MAQTLYQVLGLSPKATADEIKQAYRQLAKANHPDRNPGSKLHEERFKSITSAYEILSDERKRKRYDTELLYQAMQSINAQKRPATGPGPNSPYRGARTGPQRVYEEDTTPISQSYLFKWSRHWLAFLMVLSCFVVVVHSFIRSYQDRQDSNQAIARKDYELAIELDPNNGNAYWLRAHSMYDSLNTANAQEIVSDLEDALKFGVDPLPKGLYTELAHARMLLAKNTKQKQRACQAIQTAEEMDGPSKILTELKQQCP